MPVSPVDIITYLGGTWPPLSLSLCLPFHLGEVIHLEMYSLSFSLLSLSLSRSGAAGRTYLAHYTCAAAVYPHSSLALLAQTSKDRSSARYPAYLGIPSPSFPTLFPRPAPARLPGPEPGRGIIPLVRRLPGPASRPDSSRFWYRACAG